MDIIQYFLRFLGDFIICQMAVFNRCADIRMTQNVGHLVKGHAGLNQPACRGVSQSMQGTIL
jgi:hypothetical protein